MALPGLLAAVGLLAVVPAWATTPEGSASADRVFERLEARYGVGLTPRAAQEALGPLCREGVALACHTPGPGQDWASLAAPLCERGDSLACRVNAWAQVRRPATVEAGLRGLEAACKAGVSGACTDLGLLVVQGVGIAPNAALGRAFVAKGCGGGHAPACTWLALSEPEPAPALQKACAAGDPAACVAPALLAGLAPEAQRAAQVQACHAGLGSACLALAEQARSRPGPLGEVDRFLHFACQSGQARGCRALAALRAEEGVGVELTSPLLEGACDRGDAAACEQVVDLVRDGSLGRSVLDARSAFEVACLEGGQQEACGWLGEALLDPAARQPAQDAQRLLERGCTGPDSPALACRLLAGFYLEGRGVDRDRSLASRQLGWACNAGDAAACWSRGQLLEEGVGVARDDALALQSYRAACEGGVPRACLAAGVLLDEGARVARDEAGAEALLDQGCRAGLVLACTRLGVLQDRAARHVEARESYRAAIALGSVESRRLLARLLDQGLGGKRAGGEAKRLCVEGCRLGDPVACKGPEFQRELGALAGRYDQANLPPPPPVEAAPPPPVSAPDFLDGLVWLSRPVCRWSPPTEAADLWVEHRLSGPVVQWVAGRSEVDLPTPEAEAAPPAPLPPVYPAGMGGLFVAANPGDKVEVAGKPVGLDLDGLARLVVPAGVVKVRTRGGGRTDEVEVAVAEGHALWLSVPAPPVWRVLFAQGQSALDEAALAVIRAVAAEAADTRFEVSGSFSPDGGASANQKLADERARVTWQALLDAGVPPDRVRLVGSEPPAKGLSTAEQRNAEIRPILESSPAESP